MRADRVRLGVDFGTSSTVAVVSHPDGQVRPLLFGETPILPSAVCMDGRSAGASFLVGRDAIHAGRVHPDAFEPNPKLRVDDGSVLLGPTELPVTALIGAVLHRVNAEAERVTGAPVGEVTLTYPASWGPRRRAVLQEAARSAGMPEPSMVAEPVAAAAYFVDALGHAVPVGRCVVVYDFGAGTFDASVVGRTDEGFTVLAEEGLRDAGGLDIDNAVMAYFGATYGVSNGELWQRLTHPQTLSDRRASRHLWDDVRTGKEMLSRSASTSIFLPLVEADALLGREQLEHLARPLLDRTVAATAAAIRAAQVDATRIAGLFLVGGSSRIPLAATLLHRTLGIAPTIIEQPELVVAGGSLIASAPAANGGTAHPTTAPAQASAAVPVSPPTPFAPAAPVSPVPAAPVSPVPPVMAPTGEAPAGWAGQAPVYTVPSSEVPSTFEQPVPPTPWEQTPAEPFAAAPVSATPVSGTPMTAAPMSGPPMSAGPVSPAMGAVPVSPAAAGPPPFAPMSAAQVSAAQVSAAPTSASPIAAFQTGAAPMSAAPTSVPPAGPDASWPPTAPYVPAPGSSDASWPPAAPFTATAPFAAGAPHAGAPFAPGAPAAPAAPAAGAAGPGAGIVRGLGIVVAVTALLRFALMFQSNGASAFVLHLGFEPVFDYLALAVLVAVGGWLVARPGRSRPALAVVAGFAPWAMLPIIGDIAFISRRYDWTDDYPMMTPMLVLQVLALVAVVVLACLAALRERTARRLLPLGLAAVTLWTSLAAMLWLTSGSVHTVASAQLFRIGLGLAVGTVVVYTAAGNRAWAGWTIGAWIGGALLWMAGASIGERAENMQVLPALLMVVLLAAAAALLVVRLRTDRGAGHEAAAPAKGFAVAPLVAAGIAALGFVFILYVQLQQWSYSVSPSSMARMFSTSAGFAVLLGGALLLATRRSAGAAAYFVGAAARPLSVFVNPNRISDLLWQYGVGMVLLGIATVVLVVLLIRSVPTRLSWPRTAVAAGCLLLVAWSVTAAPYGYLTVAERSAIVVAFVAVPATVLWKGGQVTAAALLGVAAGTAGIQYFTVSEHSDVSAGLLLGVAVLATLGTGVFLTRSAPEQEPAPAGRAGRP